MQAGSRTAEPEDWEAASGGIGWESRENRLVYCVNPFVHFIFCAMQVFYISKKHKIIKREIKNF